MITSLISLIFFIGITILYSIVRFFIERNNSNSSAVLIVTLIYFSLVVVTQFFLNLYTTRVLCNESQPGTALIYTFIPWIFIFGSIFSLLKIFPGWKIPFSNTFGYLIVRLLGIRGLFHKILKSPETNNTIKTIYEDSSLTINQFTPSNFDSVYNSFVSSGLLSTDADKYKQSFKNLVLIKDYVSELVWLILTGMLISSISYNSINNATCSKSISSMQKQHRKWEVEQNKKEEPEEQPKYYITD